MNGIMDFIIKHPTCVVYSLLTVILFVIYMFKPHSADRQLVHQRKLNPAILIGSFHVEERTFVDLLFFIPISIFLDKEYSLVVNGVSYSNIHLGELFFDKVGLDLPYQFFGLGLVLMISLAFGIYGYLADKRTRNLNTITFFLLSFINECLFRGDVKVSIWYLLILVFMVAYSFIEWAFFPKDRNFKVFISIFLGGVLGIVAKYGFNVIENIF